MYVHAAGSGERREHAGAGSNSPWEFLGAESALEQRAPWSRAPWSRERLGAERLGAELLGAERLGAERLGAERLGAERLGLQGSLSCVPTSSRKARRSSRSSQEAHPNRSPSGVSGRNHRHLLTTSKFGCSQARARSRGAAASGCKRQRATTTAARQPAMQGAVVTAASTRSMLAARRQQEALLVGFVVHTAV